jgi:hypothetical protein
MQDQCLEVEVLGDDANADNIAWIAAQYVHLAEIGERGHKTMQD